MTPFALRQSWQFRVDPPPDLNSDQYADEVNEIKLIGGATSRLRNDEQSEIARHWYEASGQSWNRIARTVSEQQRLDTWQNGRLFALVNIALADGYIGAFESKYVYNFWRPITAIREGDMDGHLDTVGESEWNSYMITPAIPDWPSGHATVGAAAAEVMQRFFGTDYLAFNLTAGPPYAGTTRQYYSFSEAALENSNSRVLAGIHFRASCLAGLLQGQRIGDYVYPTSYARSVEPPHDAVRTGLLLLVIGAVCSAEPVFGTFRMNPARSTFTGDTQPRSSTVRIEPHAKGEVFTMDRIETRWPGHKLEHNSVLRWRAVGFPGFCMFGHPIVAASG